MRKYLIGMTIGAALAIAYGSGATFTAVDWSHGDPITETKLDQMVASDVHVREEANYYLIANESGAIAGDRDNGFGSFSLTFEIDGTQFGLTQSGIGSKRASDVDISAVSVGVHVATITYSRASLFGDLEVVANYRFYRSPDMNYLTWWASVAGDPIYDDLTITDVTIIGTREPKGWT